MVLENLLRPAPLSTAKACRMFPGSPNDKILALCFKTKGRDNLEPGSSWPCLCPAGLAPPVQGQSRRAGNPTVPGFVGTFFPYPFPRGEKKKHASFPRQGHPATSTRSPEPPFPAGT